MRPWDSMHPPTGAPYFVKSYSQNSVMYKLSGRRDMSALETVDLDGVAVKLKTVLGSEEFLHSLTLVTLELNHLAHLGVSDDGAIAGKLLLDDGKDLLARKLGRNALNSGQGLTSITLLDAYVNVVGGLGFFTSVLVGFGEGVVGLEIFD